MKRIGRPRKDSPPDAAERIEEDAANGRSIVGIAHHLGVGRDTLNRWMDEQPELREAFERGRERERVTLHNALFRAATEGGNVVSAMFLLKARHGYREGDQGDTANKVNITFSLPGALSMDQYREKVIEHGADSNQPLPAPRPATTRRR